MLPAFVINLKRRADRLERFKSWNRSIKMEFQIVEAIDGANVAREELLDARLVEESFCDYSEGDIGCVLSHRALWLRCLEEGGPVLILEDDAVLREDFADSLGTVVASLPKLWDTLLLGYNFDSVLDVSIVSGVDWLGEFRGGLQSDARLQRFQRERQSTQVFRLNNAFGTMAYLISPHGAEQLLQRCFPLSDMTFPIPALRRWMNPKGIDAFMNAHYRDINAYCLVPPLAVSPHIESDSDIERRK